MLDSSTIQAPVEGDTRRVGLAIAIVVARVQDIGAGAPGLHDAGGVVGARGSTIQAPVEGRWAAMLVPSPS